MHFWQICTHLERCTMHAHVKGLPGQRPSLYSTLLVPYWCARYARSQRDQLTGQAIGLPVVMAAFSFIGLAVTSATVSIFGAAVSDPLEVVARMSGAAPLGTAPTHLRPASRLHFIPARRSYRPHQLARPTHYLACPSRGVLSHTQRLHWWA